MLMLVSLVRTGLNKGGFGKFSYSKIYKSEGQLQLDIVCEALLRGKEGYSNKQHLQYIQSIINKRKRPGGSEIEAVQMHQDDVLLEI